MHEELAAALGATAYERTRERRGYRNGTIERTLTGPTGPVPLTLPRATLRTTHGEAEWRSGLVPRYERRLPEVNAAVVATYLAGGNQRRIRAALRPPPFRMSEGIFHVYDSALPERVAREAWPGRPLRLGEPDPWLGRFRRA